MLTQQEKVIYIYIQAFPGVMRGISRARGRTFRQITKVTDVEKGILCRKREWQLARYVGKNPRTTLKTLANDLTKSGIGIEEDSL